MNVDQVKIKIRTHSPSDVDQAEFSNIDDAINYLSTHKWRYQYVNRLKV